MGWSGLLFTPRMRVLGPASIGISQLDLYSPRTRLSAAKKPPEFRISAQDTSSVRIEKRSSEILWLMQNLDSDESILNPPVLWEGAHWRGSCSVGEVDNSMLLILKVPRFKYKHFGLESWLQVFEHETYASKVQIKDGSPLNLRLNHKLQVNLRRGQESTYHLQPLVDINGIWLQDRATKVRQRSMVYHLGIFLAEWTSNRGSRPEDVDKWFPTSYRFLLQGIKVIDEDEDLIELEIMNLSTTQLKARTRPNQ